MRLELLAARYRSLAVVACEWRAVDLADPERMADEAFDQLLNASDPTLAELYDAIQRVVLLTYQRHASQFSIIDRLSGSLMTRPGQRDRNELLTFLTQLRGKHRDALQLSYWDGLSDAEAAEALRIDEAKFTERRTTAETRFLAKVNKNHPGVLPLDVPELVASIKPGHHRREDR